MVVRFLGLDLGCLRDGGSVLVVGEGEATEGLFLMNPSCLSCFLVILFFTPEMDVRSGERASRPVRAARCG
jgi:hypothetical protein